MNQMNTRRLDTLRQKYPSPCQANVAKKVAAYFVYPLLAVTLTVGLFRVVRAAVNADDRDPAGGYAWSTNAGWINFSPPYGGVTVYDDHLEGYAWGENIGWIRLGTHTGGGAHTYGNTSSADYGVNRDSATDELSGYAWGTNIGWIDFAPVLGGVVIDPADGTFDGYAWGENVGWIHFKNTEPAAYGVSTLMHQVYMPLVLAGE
jgi:hypothetical protein